MLMSRHEQGDVPRQLPSPPVASTLGPPSAAQAVRVFPSDGKEGIDAAPTPHFEAALLSAVSQLGIGVAVAKDDHYVFVNDAFASMVGYSPAEMTDCGFRIPMLFSAQSAEHFGEKLAQHIDGRVDRDFFEGTLRRKDGSTVEVEIGVKALREGASNLRYAVFRDISARKRAEAQLEVLRSELARSQSLAALGSLVGGVAHEVRTPLTIIENHAQIMLVRVRRAAQSPAIPPTLVGDLEENAESIELAIRRITDLVHDLRRYSKLPASHLARGDLSEVVSDGIRLWTSTHPGSSVRVRVASRQHAPALLDPSQIQQLLLNLLDNAADAMAGMGTITVTTGTQGAEVVLAVHDEGIGLAPEALAHIFDPLYTTKTDGMGLGLDIVRRIADLHHGRIACQSVVGEGTTFTLVIPRAVE